MVVITITEAHLHRHTYDIHPNHAVAVAVVVILLRIEVVEGMEIRRSNQHHSTRNICSSNNNKVPIHRHVVERAW